MSAEPCKTPEGGVLASLSLCQRLKNNSLKSLLYDRANLRYGLKFVLDHLLFYYFCKDMNTMKYSVRKDQNHSN